MPTVTAQGKKFTCDLGSNLRQVLLDHKIDLYNSGMINCHGFGTCGTCAVKVEGEVSEIGWQEKARLSLPPHSPTHGLRLSCQTKVLGDVKVTKYDGFWGQGSKTVWTPEQ